MTAGFQGWVPSEGLVHPSNAKEPQEALEELLDSPEMERQRLCLGRSCLYMCMCVCAHRSALPGSALTQVSWEKGSEHSPKLSATHSPAAQARTSGWGRASPLRLAPETCCLCDGAGKLLPEITPRASWEARGLRTALLLPSWLPTMPKSSSHLTADKEAQEGLGKQLT